MRKRKQWAISLVLAFAMLLQLTGAAFASEAADLPEETTAVTEVAEDSSEFEETEDAVAEAAEDVTADEAEDVTADVSEDPPEPEAAEHDDEYIAPGVWSDADPYFTDDVQPEIQFVSPFDTFAGPFSAFGSPFAMFGMPSAIAEASYPTYAEVHEQLMALKDEFPEGMTWTNYEPYGSQGAWGESYCFQGGVIKGARYGVGCAALVFEFQDNVFGWLPIRVIDDPQREDFHVGDFVRVNSNHFVLITQIAAGGVTVVEGNYNKSVHWGRAISWDTLIVSANFSVTRYPAWYSEEDNPDTVVDSGTEGSLKWSLTQGGVLTISGNGAMLNFLNGDRPSWERSGKPIVSVEVEPGVTSVGDNAFFNRTDLIGASLPTTVTRIGDNAFYGTNLVGISIPGSTKTVGNNAFAYCASLTSVDIGNGVETIGERAFRACSSLQYIDLPGSLKSVGAGAFFDCQYLRQARFMPNKNNIKIGADLFYNCWYLNFVSLPEGITEIPPGLFGSCKTVQYLYIPKSVTSIAEAGKTDPFMSSGGVGVIYFGGTQAQWNNLTKAIPMSLYSTVQALSYATVVVDQKDPFVPDEHPVDDLIGCKDGKHLGPIDEETGICANCGEDTDGSSEPVDPVVPVDPSTDHDHEWSPDWSHDETHHWHECLVGGYFGCENKAKDGYEEHAFGNWEVYIAATSEQAGLERRMCSVCGHYETREIEKLPSENPVEHDHAWSKLFNSDANSHWNECENSDCPIVLNNEKDGYGKHEFGEPVIHQAATTTHAGEQYYDCLICGYRKTEVIPKLPDPENPPVQHQHNWSRDLSFDATGHWSECLMAGCPIMENLLKSGYGEHALGELVVDTPATATVAGSGHKACTVCNYSMAVTIPATGGSGEPDNPTPSNPGGTTPSNPGGTTRPGGTMNPGTSTTKPTTTTNPDGSVTTRNPDGSTTTVKTAEDGTVTTVNTDTNGQTATNVKLPAAVVTAAEQRGEVIALPMTAVSATRNATTAMPITVQFDNNDTVKVEIPVVNPNAGTVAVLVNPDGSTSVIKISVPTANGVVASLASGSTVKIVDNSKNFADVAAGAWYNDAVAFASARELFAGTSATNFSPELPMTRSMLMVVLARFAGADTTGGATWYDKATEWAVANGVSDGARPNDNISREQLVTMLWRYMGSPTADDALSAYVDADQISGYARDAMNWAVKNGLVSGFGNGRLGPQGQATRAQVATIMKNLILNLT